MTNLKERALVNRLRAELTKAEEEFRQATTPESKRRTLDRYEKALAQFSRLLLRGKPKTSAASA